jgi:hypothetical protein
MAGKKPAPAKFEEEDEAETWEDGVADGDEKDAQADLRMRDWRDVERYREMKELKSLVDDAYGLEEIFQPPPRLRAPPIPPRAAAIAAAKAGKIPLKPVTPPKAPEKTAAAATKGAQKAGAKAPLAPPAKVIAKPAAKAAAKKPPHKPAPKPAAKKPAKAKPAKKPNKAKKR